MDPDYLQSTPICTHINAMFAWSLRKLFDRSVRLLTPTLVSDTKNDEHAFVYHCFYNLNLFDSSHL